MNLLNEMLYEKSELAGMLSEDYYCKLPNGLFYGKEENEVGILKLMGDKALPILEYLYTNTNRKNIVNFTLEQLIVACGFKPNANKVRDKNGNRIKDKNGNYLEKSNDQFKNVLAQFQQLEIIISDVDMGKIKPKDWISCSLQLKLDKQFVILMDSEKEKISSQSIEKVDNLKLLIYYCYLKCRMYKRSKKQGDLVDCGGRAEVCWVGYKTINEDLGLTDESITKYNEILIALDMIRIGNAGHWYFKDDRNKSIRESSNIYTLWTEGKIWELNLKDSIKSYKVLDINSNKVFTNNKVYLNNNRKLNGALGAIIKKENNGTATEKDIKRKADILESRSEKMEQKHKIKSLLEINQNWKLSDIYFNLGKEDICNEIGDLETALGLVDRENELTVDWDYYCWVMINYEESEHNYYTNCVSKKNETTIKYKKTIAV